MANDYKEYQFIGHVRVKKIRVKCFRCGHTMIIRFDRHQLARGIGPPPKLCSSCKDIDPEGYLFGDLINPEAVMKVEEIIERNKGLVSCKHIRPGDPEFDEIAAQCTPPSQIKEQTHIPYLDWGKP